MCTILDGGSEHGSVRGGFDLCSCTWVLLARTEGEIGGLLRLSGVNSFLCPCVQCQIYIRKMSSGEVVPFLWSTYSHRNNLFNKRLNFDYRPFAQPSTTVWYSGLFDYCLRRLVPILRLTRIRRWMQINHINFKYRQYIGFGFLLCEVRLGVYSVTI